MMTIFILLLNLPFVQHPAGTLPLCSTTCQLGQLEGWSWYHPKFTHSHTWSLSWEDSRVAGVVWVSLSVFMGSLHMTAPAWGLQVTEQHTL